jgi:hypothetical protein
MYVYPVYRYRSHSDRTFARVGSILGYKGPIGSGAYSSLLQEAKRLFAAGDDDIILLGPSPIAIFNRTVSSPGNADLAACSRRDERTDKEETGVNCS